MKIYSMTATFGKLEHQTLTLEPGLNIIHAPNEWGKSTWCAFLLAMLYGIDTKERTKMSALADKERYAPWSGSPMSGRMELNWNGRDITIERANKGRLIFGDFKAYETATGLPIPELTAANCGEVLLGVEKSVFARAGFLKLTDLPVTQDESFRRRLNALVTTGDESGSGDILSQKLKELKNNCRFNRTGRLPQALAQRDELEWKLRELREQKTQIQRLKERQVELAEFYKRLQNHLTALEYAANRGYGEKLAAAEANRDIAEAKLAQWETACEAIPKQSEIEDKLTALRGLREEWDEIHIDSQMAPSQPQPPQVLPQFQGLSAEDALRQAQTDVVAYETAVFEKKKRGLGIVGLLLALVAVGALLIPNTVIRFIGAAGVLAGIFLCRINIVSRRRAERTASDLLGKYKPLMPEEWVMQAERSSQLQEEYMQAQENREKILAALNQRMEKVREKLHRLTGGSSFAECEKDWKAKLETRKALEDAKQEQKRAEELVQVLRSSYKETPLPQFPDTLNWDAAETQRLLSSCEFDQKQLQTRLGQCQGRMDTLGQEEPLVQQLEAVNERISKLEDVYAALTVAQQTLADAADALQRRFAPRIAKRAQTIFSKLTAGRYQRLTLGQDLSLNTSAQGEDTLHSALWRSDGTADQLYLALRLAVAGELTPDAPLVLDDALVRFDDQRLQEAVRILEEEAEGKQVLLFTCQKRESQARQK